MNESTNIQVSGLSDRLTDREIEAMVGSVLVSRLKGVAKTKGIATIRFENGSTRRAEIHWYEATGIGKKEFKIKYLLD